MTIIDKRTKEDKEIQYNPSILTSKKIFSEVNYDNQDNPKCYLREHISLLSFLKYYELLLNIKEDNPLYYNICLALEYIFSDYFRKHDIIIEIYEQMFIGYRKWEISNIYREFANLEQCIYAFNRKTYRDHFLHMFNVYMMGEIILGKISKYINSKNLDFCEIFKIKDEHEDMKQVREKEPVKEIKAEQRIFPIWFYMSIFHDIGYPIQKFEFLEDIVNVFRKRLFFDTRIWFDHDFYYFPILKQKDKQIRKMIGLFDCELSIKDGGDYEYTPNHFNKPTESSLILEDIKERSHGRNIDHGIVSSILLFHYITEDAEKFYLDKSEKYFEHYINHDLCRSALGICLHNLDPKKMFSSNLIFPIRFDKFPLIFLLILCDNLEEWGRPEYFGNFFPEIAPIDWDINFIENGRLIITITIDLSKAVRDNKFNKILIKLDKQNSTFNQWFEFLTQKLESKISLGDVDWLEFIISFKLPGKTEIETYLENSRRLNSRKSKILEDYKENLTFKIK